MVEYKPSSKQGLASGCTYALAGLWICPTKLISALHAALLLCFFHLGGRKRNWRPGLALCAANILSMSYLESIALVCCDRDPTPPQSYLYSGEPGNQRAAANLSPTTSTKHHQPPGASSWGDSRAAARCANCFPNPRICDTAPMDATVECYPYDLWVMPGCLAP